ncbi:hypothetical protein [Methyloceanibacter sp.]|nr:hypothetical protein [Methyloceanibacter sp.]
MTDLAFDGFQFPPGFACGLLCGGFAAVPQLLEHGMCGKERIL